MYTNRILITTYILSKINTIIIFIIIILNYPKNIIKRLLASSVSYPNIIIIIYPFY